MKKSKRKTILWTVFFLVVTIGVCFAFVPLFQNLKFGLDLQGGFEVLYEVETIDGSKMTNEKLTSTYKTISKRIDVLGVTEPEIVLEGNNKIRVKLAGIKNQDEARNALSTVASLSFRDTNDNLLMTSDVLKAGGAKLSVDNSGNPAVSLAVKDRDTFYDVTNKVKDYTDNKIVIWLDFDELHDSYSSEKEQCGSLSDSKCLSSATVDQGFASDVIIQGNFTEEEAKNLVELINSGSLPTKLKEVSSKTVGASFGQDTLQNTFVAGVIGVSLIILLMIVIYRFVGLLSGIAMVFYTFLVFLVFWVVGGNLTLPGIAAMVLGIGMAVDANVLLFSRMKEELYEGYSLKEAYQRGTKRSFKTILDSNLTTLLVAIILFIFGESSVKGFATMLIITIAVTMFTMVFLTRVLLNRFIKTDYFANKLRFFIGVDPKNVPDRKKKETRKIYPFLKINFVKLMKPCAIFSLLIIALGMLVTFTKGLHLGIDYQGGSDITMKTSEKVEEKALTADLKSLQLTSTDLTVSGEEVFMKIEEVLDASKVKEVSRYFEDKYQAKVDIGVVSNVVKRDLTKNAVLSILLAMLGIILYISFRFRFSYAISSVVALLHDVLIMISLFALLQLEVSVMFIAAILAIIGYSINDTIVSFDRIREKMEQVKNRKLVAADLDDVVNQSLRETLGRSLCTTVTTLLPVIALIFLGSSEILHFNLAMLFGLVSGTYSSIFIASYLWLLLEKRQLKKIAPTKKKKRKLVVEDDVDEHLVKGVNA